MNATSMDSKRVMVVLAHPDDPEFFCGGTVGRWTSEGAEVIYVVVTRGERGSDDPDIDIEELARTRQAEQRAAASVLGVKEVVFLGHPDGSVVANLELRRDITREIRRWKPEVVITCDPVRSGWRYINHPDHRAVGEAALDAVFPDSRNPLQFPELLKEEGLEPHHVYEVYIAGATEPDMEIDITNSLELKLAALRQHRTQISDPEGLEVRLRERYRVESDDGETRYVERFKYIGMRR